MTITFLGTGSIIPSPQKDHTPHRSYSSILVEIDDETLLFDIGPGTLTKLQQEGIDTRNHPQHLFITHYHIDHCQDFVGLVKGRCFDAKTGRIGLGAPIHIYGPTDLHQWSRQLFSQVKRWSYMSKDLSYKDVAILHEIKDSRVVETSQWKVTCCPVDHFDGVAFRVDAHGKSFVYSGDMGYDERLATLGQNADVVAIECSFPDRASRLGKHLCPEDVGMLAAKGNFAHVVLTHLYPLCEGREEEMKDAVREKCDAKVTIADDFLELDL